MSKRRIIVNGPWRDALIDWMSERIGVEGQWRTDEARVIAHVIDDGGPASKENVLAVVLLNHWTPHTCEGNIASDGTKRWFSRGFVFAIYDYVFNQAGKSRMTFVVAPENTSAVQMHEQLGHVFEGRLQDADGEGRDLLLYGLTKRQWLAGRWAKPPSLVTTAAVNTAQEVKETANG